MAVPAATTLRGAGHGPNGILIVGERYYAARPIVAHGETMAMRSIPSCRARSWTSG